MRATPPTARAKLHLVCELRRAGCARYARAFVADAGAPRGVAISNAVLGVTPRRASEENVALVTSLLAPCLFASDPAIVPMSVVREGQTVAGVGAVAGVRNLVVNSLGQRLVEADTNNANMNVDGVVLDAAGVRFQEGQALSAPTGWAIGGFDSLTLNEAGDSGWNHSVTLRPTVMSSGVEFNDKLLLLEDSISARRRFRRTLRTSVFSKPNSTTPRRSS